MKSSDRNSWIAVTICSAIAVWVYSRVGFWFGGWGDLIVWLFSIGVMSTVLNSASKPKD